MSYLEMNWPSSIISNQIDGKTRTKSHCPWIPDIRPSKCKAAKKGNLIVQKQKQKQKQTLAKTKTLEAVPKTFHFNQINLFD